MYHSSISRKITIKSLLIFSPHLILKACFHIQIKQGQEEIKPDLEKYFDFF